MAPPRTWAELPPDLLTCVADRLHAVPCYFAARGVCAAWRSALPPPSHFLLAADGFAHALFLPSPRAFRLPALPRGGRCVGSSHGWLAVASEVWADESSPRVTKGPYKPRAFGAPRKVRIALVNPLTGDEVVLPEHERLTCPVWSVSKVVFARNPRKDDFAVVAAVGANTLAWVTSSARDDGGGDGACCWSFTEIAEDTALADVVYRDGCGGDGGGDKVYCLTRSGDVHVLHVPRGGGRPATPPPPAVTLEPLLPERRAGARFDPAAVFFPPAYARLSELVTGAKSLVFCGDGGELYQVWRNTVGGRFTVRTTPGGGEPGCFTVSQDEVFVLRYDAARRPCWEAVADLGGRAVFVGPANTAMSVRAGDVPAGLKGDCVYWIGGFGGGPAMVFDMRTRRCTPCLAPAAAGGGKPVCWYLLGDMGRSNDDDGGESLERPQKRRRCSVVEQEPVNPIELNIMGMTDLEEDQTVRQRCSSTFHYCFLRLGG